MSRGQGLLGMGGTAGGLLGSRGSCQGSAPHGPVQGQRPGLEMVGGNPTQGVSQLPPEGAGCSCHVW